MIGSIGGIVNALLMTQSTRPKASSDFATRRARESSSVTSVTTLTTLVPCPSSSAWSSSSRDSVRLAITRSAPIFTASSASARPRPGPMPEMTTTFPFSRGTAA